MDIQIVQLLAEDSSTETRAREKPSDPQMPTGHECTAAPAEVITDLPFTDEKSDPAQSLGNTAPMWSSPLQYILKLFVNPLESYTNGLIYLETKI